MASPTSSPAVPHLQAAKVRLPARPPTVTRIAGGVSQPVLRRAQEPRQLELDLRRSV